MLGATHALANPLSAHYDMTHGIAIGIMLPHVIRYNAEVMLDEVQIRIDSYFKPIPKFGIIDAQRKPVMDTENTIRNLYGIL